MKSLRLLLYPFSLLYAAITRLRNWAFDVGILKHESFDVPVIAVGNLSTGGTGKTPMIEYLVHQLADKKVAVLSRGYGRKTRGYRLVKTDSIASEVGDEPLQIKKKFGDSNTVAVCEKRVDGIKKILDYFQPDVILLDDAFQHRYVKAQHYVLLTSYDEPYFNDYVLPAGNLRESRSGAQRAHSIVVTKCPLDLDHEKMKLIRDKINPSQHQQVYFSTIAYADSLIGKNSAVSIDEMNTKAVTAVTGIAKPEPFVEYLSQFFEVKHMRYSDHHKFSANEIEQLKKENVIITTEKDFMRLGGHDLEQLYYLPMQTKFIGAQLSIYLANLKY